jgi:hypothetical protein
METYTVLRSPKYGVTQKLWLILALIITGLFSIIPFFWLYQKVKFRFGIEVAEIGLTVGVIFLLAWTTLGIFAGSKIDRMIREQKSFFSASQKNKSAEILMRIWGYEKLYKEVSESENIEMATGPDLDMDYEEVMSLVNQPNRRGRTPDFVLDDWIRVARKWEAREPGVDAYTLADVISEKLGIHPDGSPAMSEQSYYKTWRKRALEELERRAKLKKKRESKISAKK